MDLEHEGGSPWDDVPSQSKKDSEVPSSQSSPKAPRNNAPAAAAGATAATTITTTTTTTSSKGRAQRTPRRYGAAQTTRLEAVDDSLGPLGPLGPLGSSGDDFASQSEETLLPQAQQHGEQQHPAAVPASRSDAGSHASLRTLMGSVNLEDADEDDDAEGSSRTPRVPPPVQPPMGDSPQRHTQPSVSIVEAAKPTFQISIGDPHKVGDLTSAHTEYLVQTKTTSKAYRNPEFTVSRRFRDFLWLYNQLHNNNPGVIVPPPPEKQAVGRFNADFVESRRQALERMLNKTAAHPTLQLDADLKLFLESDAFNVDIKHKERKEPLVGESKGMLSSIGIGASTTKFVEHDDWFHDRRVYLDALENQLKALEKANDMVVSQRKSLAEACGDFSNSLNSLAAVELSPMLSGPLEGLSDLQERIRELYDRQAQQDVLTLGIVIDEYIRMIGSCKMAFNMREKSYYGWHAAEADLAKKKTTQDKLMRQGRSQTDRLNQLGAEVADAEKKAHQARLLFDDMGRILRHELDRFEREKVEEFKSGVETYLESAVEAQKELIEIWETYLMRLDAEDDVLPDESAPQADLETAVGSGRKSATASEEHGDRPESRDTDTVESESQAARGDDDQTGL